MTAGGPTAATSTDVELLRAYEPAIRYTDGELFFPAAVDPYIAECDLFVGRSGRERRIIVPAGELTIDALTSHRAGPGETLSMRLVQQPMRAWNSPAEIAEPTGPCFERPVDWPGWASSLVSSIPRSRRRCSCAEACPVARPRRHRSSTKRSGREIRGSCTTGE